MRLSLGLGLASETGDKGVSDSVLFARLNRYESRSRLVCETPKGFSLGLGLAHKYWSRHSVIYALFFCFITIRGIDTSEGNVKYDCSL